MSPYSYPDGCVEGCVIEASVAGLLAVYIVKGYEHPDDGLVVIPYRLGSERSRIEGAFAAPYMLQHSTSIAPLRRLPCMPRPVPVVEYSRVVSVYEPSSALHRAWHALPRHVRSLLERIDYEWAGLTGSWAISAETGRSDVDVVFYGSGVYDSLVEAAQRLGWYSCTPRPDRVRPGSSLGVLYKVKFLELCKGPLRVTIRILRTLNQQPCTRRRIGVGYVRTEVLLEDIGESYLVPARYKLSGGITGFLETWRTRFQELPPGLYTLRGEVWIEGNTLYVSPDIGGAIAPKAWYNDS